MKTREFVLSTGTRIFLGKDENGNDELVKSFKGKENVILHTVARGSPFCVIEKLSPSEKEIYEAGIFCALKSQDWRDNKGNVRVNIFSGKDVKKTIFMKPGSWKLKKIPKEVLIKKKDIKNFKLKLEK